MKKITLLTLLIIFKVTFTNAQQPSISSFTPNGTCAGTSTSVTIFGTNFTGATAVNFGGTAASSFLVNSASRITAIAPVGVNTGAITVTTSGGTATSSATFIIGNSYTAYAYATISGSNNVSVINTTNNTIVTTVSVGSNPSGVGVSPNGTTVYTANNSSNNVSVINTVTNTVTSTIGVGNYPVGICVSPDGSKVFVVNSNPFGGNGSISIINTATNSVTTTVAVGNYPLGICISPDGSKAYVVNNNDNTVSVLNTANNTIVTTISVGASPLGISITPDGSLVYVANQNAGSVSVINTSSNTVISTVSVGSWPWGTSVSPDGQNAYVTNFASNIISIINISTNIVTNTVGVGNGPRGISVSPDGSKIYVGNSTDNTVSVISTTTNTVVATVSVGRGQNAVGNFIANVPTTCPAPTYIWTGAISTDWNIAGNWSSNLVPTSTCNVTIPSAPTNQPKLSTDVVINDIAIDGSVTINSKTFTINGAVTGTGNLAGSQSSSLLIGGTAGTINFAPNKNSLQNLTINGTATLGNALNLYGTLTSTSGTLTTGGFLTLKSISTGTAVVAPVYSSINGTVNIERYIPQGYSAHRDLGVCVNGAGTIANTWGDSLEHYVVYNYNAASGWDTVPNTTSLNKYKGYRVLVSGHNNPVVPTTTISYMNSDVTLAYSGTLLTGNQSIPITGGQNSFSFVSNPYASQVDFNALTKSSLYDGYWYLDPTTLYGTYEDYNYYGVNIGVSNIYGKSAGQYLQPGQAFFVCSNTSGTPSLTFTESAKNNGNGQLSIFGVSSPLNRIATGLFANSKNLDGAVVVFNSNFSDGVGKEDGLKINNQRENLTFKVGGKDLCANGCTMPKATDELPLHLYQLNTNTAYTLRLDASQFVGNGLAAYIKDNVLNTQTLLTGDSNIVSFTTTTDTATYSNRYSIVFGSSTLPVKSIGLTATELQNNQVSLKWSVIGETNVADYKVERSIDDITFSDLATVSATSSNNYTYLDATTSEGSNYYRIKATDNLGEVSYSKVVSVQLSANSKQLIVYPNPVTNCNFKFGIANIGKYTISVVDKLGQTVYSTTINHSVSSALETVTLRNQLAAGSYTLTARDEDGKALRSTEIIIK